MCLFSSYFTSCRRTVGLGRFRRRCILALIYRLADFITHITLPPAFDGEPLARCNLVVLHARMLAHSARRSQLCHILWHDSACSPAIARTKKPIIHLNYLLLLFGLLIGKPTAQLIEIERLLPHTVVSHCPVSVRFLPFSQSYKLKSENQSWNAKSLLTGPALMCGFVRFVFCMSIRTNSIRLNEFASNAVSPYATKSSTNWKLRSLRCDCQYTCRYRSYWNEMNSIRS